MNKKDKELLQQVFKEIDKPEYSIKKELFSIRNNYREDGYTSVQYKTSYKWVEKILFFLEKHRFLIKIVKKTTNVSDEAIQIAYRTGIMRAYSLFRNQEIKLTSRKSH